MRLILAPLALLAILGASCGGSAEPKATEPPKNPEDTAERFLTLWKERKYAEMYALVSSEARLTISEQDFVGRYEAITDEATITDIDFTLKTEPAFAGPGRDRLFGHHLHFVLRRATAG